MVAGVAGDDDRRRHQREHEQACRAKQGEGDGAMGRLREFERCRPTYAPAGGILRCGRRLNRRRAGRACCVAGILFGQEAGHPDVDSALLGP